MQATIGQYALVSAFLLALYSIASSLIGARQKRADLIESSERAVIAVAFLIILATGVLLHALLTNNFAIEYVAHYSSTTLPPAYRITSLWGGQAGSLLFWVLILVSFSVVVLLQNQNRNRRLMPYVIAVLMAVTSFFVGLLLFVASPFVKSLPVPIEGQGLNPLLQNYWMASHPPFLYGGYVGQAIPFAFAMAALMANQLDIGWIKSIRRWTLVSWLFLTIGILQGSYWAYIELGWGGYWAWDPVENASLMPWLASTAFLHSVMIQEKKGMLKNWNMLLVIAAFSLSIFGTFLTRSGVVSSVHSFAQSPIGTYFLVFLAAQIGLSIFLVRKRKEQLAPEAKLESFVSRESSFLLNNVFFLVICLAVLLGTTFPIISEWVTGSKVTVSAPFFNIVIGPFAIGLVVLTGICPLIAWRKAGLKNLQHNFLFPAIFGIAAVAVLFALGTRHWLTLLYVFSSAFVLATVVFEFTKGTQARKAMVNEAVPAAFYHLVQRNKRRYGGFVIHAGVALLFIGIAASSYYRLEKDAMVKVNESFRVGSYNITFRELTTEQDPNKEIVRAKLDVERNGKSVFTLFPERRFYKNSEQPTTEVALRPFWNEDLYLILGGWDDQGAANFKVYVNPFIGLLWWGGILMALGGLVVLLPAYQPALAPVRRPTLLGAEERA